MPRMEEMLSPARDPEPASAVAEGVRACERARDAMLPPHVRAARDALFEDADRHGPRWPVLVREIVPAMLLFVVAMGATSNVAWRELVAERIPTSAIDLVLVAPVLVAIVLLAAAMAPLARIATSMLLGAGTAFVAGGALLAHGGQLALATVPSAAGMLLLGLAAARGVHRTIWTVPILVAAGISDAWSVQGGLTSRLLPEGAGASVFDPVPTTSVDPSLVTSLDMLVLHIPSLDGTWLLGLVDVLAMGLLFGLAHVFWQPLRRSVLAIGAALVAVVAMGSVLPVLPVLGAAWVLAHAQLVLRSLRFSLRRLTYLGG